MASRLPLVSIAASILLSVGLLQRVTSATAPMSLSIEAEDCDSFFGVDPKMGNGQHLGHTYQGNWAMYRNVNFMNGQYDRFFAYVKLFCGAPIQVRIDRVDGPLIGTLNHSVCGMGGDATASDSTTIIRTTGIHDLYLVFPDPGNGFYDPFMDYFGFRGLDTIRPGDAVTYYVDAVNGVDGGDGRSLTTAFKTIQQAASVMNAGSSCEIRGGIYREDVRPVYTGLSGAPITFRAHLGEDVFLSAADPITGWSKWQGSIYRAPMKWSLGKFRNQIFVDGNVMYDARTPNIEAPCDPASSWSQMYCMQNRPDLHPLMRQSKAYIHTYFNLAEDNDHYYIGLSDPGDVFWEYSKSDDELFRDKPANYYVGGLYIGYYGWWAGRGTIFASTATPPFGQQPLPRGILFTMERKQNQSIGSGAGNGIILGVLNLLDSPGEWYWDDRDSMLYAWMPNSDDPSTHLVEAKKRSLVLDLSGKGFITVTGLKSLGGSITLQNAYNCVIDHHQAKYVSHFWDLNAGWEGGYNINDQWDAANFTRGQYGIFLGGWDNVIRNSLIAVSAGSGVIMDGLRNKVDNCVIHTCNYVGGYHAGVYCFDSRSGDVGWGENIGEPWAVDLEVARNTISGMNRSAIFPNNLGWGIDGRPPLKVQYNDLSLTGLWSWESGAYYVSGGGSGLVEICNNWFHSECRQGNSYIGLDNGHAAHRIHHNVFFTGNPVTPPPDIPRLGTPIFCDSINDIVFNNTFVIDSAESHFWQVQNGGPDGGAGEVWYQPSTGEGYEGHNNLYCIPRKDTARWRFTDASSDDYSLREGSPAIDAGHVLGGRYAPYEESFVGSSPDFGAYEYGKPAWKAGADWRETAWTYPPARMVGAGLNALSRPRQGPGIRAYRGNLRITAPDATPYQVRVFDIAGRMTTSLNRPKGGSAVVGLQRQSSGIRIARVTYRNGSVVRRIVNGAE